MSDLNMDKGPDPQAEATKEAFTRAAGNDSSPNASEGTGPQPPVDDANRLSAGMSFAHQAAPSSDDQSLKQEFNQTAHRPEKVGDEAKEDQPPTQANKIQDPEFKMPPEIPGLREKLDRRLDLGSSDQLSLNKGPKLGL